MDFFHEQDHDNINYTDRGRILYNRPIYLSFLVKLPPHENTPRLRKERLMRKAALLFPIAIIFLIIAAACNAQTSGGASQAVENYLRALVDRDLNAMIVSSCADWEADAKTEFDSFAAVKLNLNDLACQEVEKQGAAVLVTCSGSIIANYGAEDLEIDVADRTYQAIDEGGEWRMCGYFSK
jgi:hypothetical protein